MVLKDHATTSLPSEYRDTLARATAIIEQKPFDDFGVFQSQQSCCTPRNTDPNHRLCSACCSLVAKLRALLETRDDNTHIVGCIALCHTLGELWRAADAGCHMCAIIKGSTLYHSVAFTPEPFEYGRRRMSRTWLALAFHSSANLGKSFVLKTLIFSHDYTSSSPRPIELSFTGFSKQEITSQFEFVNSTGGDGSMQLASQWLRTCRQSHGDCAQPPNVDPGLPRRLVKIEDTNIRVVLNNGFEYTCLSHCWGDQSKMPKLSDGDLSRAVFEINGLPKTFQDAIQVSKRLGHDYIWIDSLCIVQTSRQDWFEQSCAMADIYSNSEFTIAALASSNGSEGCFRPVSYLMTTPLHIEGMIVQIGKAANFFHLEVVGTTDYISPLHKRGWVVQERLWAPRTIFFGDLGLHWECRTLQTSQLCQQPYEIRNEQELNNFKFRLKGLFCGSSEPEFSKYSIFQEAWYQILDVYTNCALTYHSDRLPALMGVANAVSRRNGDKWIQGLWKSYATDEILWRVSHNQNGPVGIKLSGRPKINSPLPTWSWASVQGRIVHLSPVGKISWQAPVVFDGDGLTVIIDTYIHEVVIDEDDNVLVLKRATSGENVTEDDGSNYFGWYPDDENDIPQNISIALVQKRVVSMRPLQESIDCLVLSATNESKYTRIGVCRLRSGSLSQDPFVGQMARVIII